MPRVPKGWGTIKKLSGNRSRPYMAMVPNGYELGIKIKDIGFLADALEPDLFDVVSSKYRQYCEGQKVCRQIYKTLGYYSCWDDAFFALTEYNRLHYDIDKRNTTFEQVYNAVYQDKISKMEKRSYIGYTSAYRKCAPLQQLKMRDIRKNQLQSIIDNYSDMSIGTQRKLINLLHLMYKFAIENDICEKNYSEFLEITAKASTVEVNPFTADEVNIIRNALDFEVCFGSRSKALEGQKPADTLLILIYTGMRIDEFLNIKTEDVNITDEQNYIHVKGSKTKSANRIVPIHPEILPYIKKRCRQYPDGYLISSREGEKISYDVYRNQFFRPFCKKYELHHRIHDTRKTFASFAVKCNLNPIITKRILGHVANDITLDVYTHTFTADLCKEIKKFTI